MSMLRGNRFPGKRRAGHDEKIFISLYITVRRQVIELVPRAVVPKSWKRVERFSKFDRKIDGALNAVVRGENERDGNRQM